MLFHHNRAERLAGIADQLRSADRLSTNLVSGIASEFTPHSSASASAHIRALIAAGAWTDAALALLAEGLPRWKLRRLAYDDGVWHCALSLQRNLPEWLDEEVETNHQDISLALFKGLVEAARQEPSDSGDTSTPAAPRIRIKQIELICCDNFA